MEIKLRHLLKMIEIKQRMCKVRFSPHLETEKQWSLEATIRRSAE